MGTEDIGKDAPSLAPPSLRLGRKKAKPAPDTTAQATPEKAPPKPGPKPAPQADPHRTPKVRRPALPRPALPRPAVPRPALPAVNDRAAAAVTGLVTGALLVLSLVASEALCESVRGTPSCGPAGLPLAVAVLIVTVLAGVAMLRGFGLPSPGSISFLSVSLVAVLSLLFLVDVIDQWWVLVVVPVLSLGSFVLFHWVTTTYIDPADPDR